ncbi:hypothetical protein [Chromobacterium aquaticum]|uniref:Uncharacterized protein n=1 Tax=Chromobacterium aquaticum TaxID=467180 RepID=A0ABV9A031_9NEIS|nr:hypothetical protein [Chromobacterium aquaticum]MCD5361145.1 hypothetical protein [Chromobacterium aquaticum]
MRQVIRLYPEYFCHCLWRLFDDDRIEYFLAERFPILKNEVRNWERLLQQKLQKELGAGYEVVSRFKNNLME